MTDLEKLQAKEKELVQRELKIKEKEGLLNALEKNKITNEKSYGDFISIVRGWCQKADKFDKLPKNKEGEAVKEATPMTDEMKEAIQYTKQAKQKEKRGQLEKIIEGDKDLRFLSIKS